jgi:rubrerythrin
MPHSPTTDLVFASWRDALDFAVESEEQAIRFYQDLGSRAATPELRGLFINFAREEERHKVRLLDALTMGVPPLPAPLVVESLGLAERMEAPTAEPRTMRDALVVAMDREKRSFRLYTGLAANSVSEGFRSLFTSLAQEEAAHKLYFETRLEDLLFDEP